MDDDKNGKEGPGLFTEHGDEEGENSDSGGSNVEEEHVRPYEHDPSFKSKEELEHFLKGKLGDFFLLAQSFYRPKTKTSFNRQFSPKRPKLVKNQAKGSEIHQIRTKWHPSYCGNPSILSSDLAVKIKRSLQGSPVENKMLRSWMFFALPRKHPTSEHFIFNR